MPGPFLCGLAFCQASLLPKLRDHFAEFLGNASSAGLGILSPSTCVGLRYGPVAHNSGFSRQALLALRYPYVCSASRLRLMHRGFPSCAAPALAPVFPFPACLLCPRPHISGATGYRNFNLLSIGYALKPRLRPRLTQGRQASPWKPWIFGR